MVSGRTRRKESEGERKTEFPSPRMSVFVWRNVALWLYKGTLIVEWPAGGETVFN